MQIQSVSSNHSPLNNIPQRKLDLKLQDLLSQCETCSKSLGSHSSNKILDGLCGRCSFRVIAYNRYAEANIPVEYWDLSMEEFRGPVKLKEVYDAYIERMETLYAEGKQLSFAGPLGIGKTTVSNNVLKKACQKNYVCQYTTLSDIVSSLTGAAYESRFDARRTLMMCDFLVVDEFDPSYIGSELTADLFGRTIECVFRARLGNRLPTIFCTNSPNPTEAFLGTLKQSIESLMSKVQVISVIGKDQRKEVENK